MRGLCFLLLALAGCKPAQVTLGVPPGFYPSAMAHDPPHLAEALPAAAPALVR